MPACKVCTKSVYPMDPQVNLDGTIFHKACAKCQDCNCQISLSNFTKNETKDTFTLLCKTHYFKRFRENGSYPGAEQFQKNVNRNETAAILVQKVITTAGPAKQVVAPQLLGTVPTKSALPTSTPVKSNDASENPVSPSQWTTALKRSSLTVPTGDSADDKGKQSTPTQWSQAIKRNPISQTPSDDQNEKSSTPSAWTGALRRGSKSVENETNSPGETNSTPQAWNTAIRRKSVESSEVTNASEKAELSSPPQSWNTAIRRSSKSNPNEDAPLYPKGETEAPAAWSNVLKKSTDKEEEVPAPIVVSSIESEPIVKISHCPAPVIVTPVEYNIPVVDHSEIKDDQTDAKSDHNVSNILQNHVMKKKSPLTIPIVEPAAEDTRASIDEFSDTESGLTPIYANDREELEDTGMDKIAQALGEESKGPSNEEFDDDDIAKNMSKVVNKIIDDDDDLAPVNIVATGNASGFKIPSNDDDDDLSPVAVSDKELKHNNHSPAFI